MKFHTTLLSTAAACLLTPLLGLADVSFYTVPASANVISAGLASPVSPGGDGSGTLPVQLAVPTGAAFQFQSSGSVSPFYSTYDLSGEGTPVYPTSVNSYGGVSGFHSDQAFALTGVFLSDAIPQAPAPATLDFTGSGIGRNFLTLNPLIGQVFYIGNGSTDGAAIQTFYAPAGATRLFLGFADAVDFLGDTGNYGDNQGSLSVGVTVVPEPSSVLLVLSGIIFLAIRKR